MVMGGHGSFTTPSLDIATTNPGRHMWRVESGAPSENLEAAYE